MKEYERTHNHFWNIHKHKKLGDLKVKVTSLDDFKGRIARREEEFAKKRSRHHGVFDAMSSLGPAVEVIGGQAAGAGALVSWDALVSL